MRQIYYVTKEDLLQVYGGNLVGYYNGDGTELDLNKAADEEIEVEIDRVAGPYATIKLVTTYQGLGMLIIPRVHIKSKSAQEAWDLFTPILDKYHKDHWYWKTNGELYIHYPVITITNSINKLHVIHDLVVRVVVNTTTGQLASSIQGARVSYTTRELHCHYKHSHLKRGVDRAFGDFCKGPAFIKYVNGLCKTNTAFEFDMFLEQLRAYLEWESLEGTPYISITELNSEGAGSRDSIRFNTGQIAMTGEGLNMLAVRWLELILDSPHINLILIGRGQQVTLRPSENLFDTERLLTDWAAHHIGSQVFLEITRDYDLVKSVYLSPNTNNYSNISDLPTSEDVVNVIGRLKIKARIINTDDSPEQTSIIKRFHTNVITRVLQRMNTILLRGTHDVTDTENESRLQSRGTIEQGAPVSDLRDQLTV